MLLQSPRDLHYPITITKLLKQPNDNVERFAPLFSYSYKTTVTEGNRFGDEFQVEKVFPTNFESSVNGVLKSWSIDAGAVISLPGSVCTVPSGALMPLLTPNSASTSPRLRSRAPMACNLVACASIVDKI